MYRARPITLEEQAELEKWIADAKPSATRIGLNMLAAMWVGGLAWTIPGVLLLFAKDVWPRLFYYLLAASLVPSLIVAVGMFVHLLREQQNKYATSLAMQKELASGVVQSGRFQSIEVIDIAELEDEGAHYLMFLDGGRAVKIHDCLWKDCQQPNSDFEIVRLPITKHVIRRSVYGSLLKPSTTIQPAPEFYVADGEVLELDLEKLKAGQVPAV